MNLIAFSPLSCLTLIRRIQCPYHYGQQHIEKDMELFFEWYIILASAADHDPVGNVSQRVHVIKRPNMDNMDL